MEARPLRAWADPSPAANPQAHASAVRRQQPPPPPHTLVHHQMVNPNEIERRAAAERSLSLRVTQMVGARPAPVLGSAAPDSSCGYSQQQMPMGYPPPPGYYQQGPDAAGPPLPGYYPQGPIAAGSAVRAVYNNRPQSPGPSALSRSQQSLMAPAGAPAGAPMGAEHMWRSSSGASMSHRDALNGSGLAAPQVRTGPDPDFRWRLDPAVTAASSGGGGEPRPGGSAEQRAERMAAENAVLREELRRMPEELQRSSRLDQKRLEGQISRLQSEVRTLLADVVAAKEGLKQSELRIEAECAAAATVAHDEAFEAAREEKEKALRLAATHAATALEDALSRAKAERDAALAAAATRSERALAEERQRSQREIADAIARAKVEAAEAMAAEKGELHARLERVAQEAEAIRDELGRSKRAMEDAVQAERAKAQRELQAAAERAAADLAAAAEKAQREQAVALKAMEESYLANPIIKEVEVIKQVVKVKEVIKEVPKPVYVEVEKVVYREKGKPKTALPWEQPRPRTAPSGLPRTAPSGVADSVTIPAADAPPPPPPPAEHAAPPQAPPSPPKRAAPSQLASSQLNHSCAPTSRAAAAAAAEAIALDAAERLTSLKLAGVPMSPGQRPPSGAAARASSAGGIGRLAIPPAVPGTALPLMLTGTGPAPAPGTALSTQPSVEYIMPPAPQPSEAGPLPPQPLPPQPAPPLLPVDEGALLAAMRLLTKLEQQAAEAARGPILPSPRRSQPSADCNQLMGPSALMPMEPEGRAQDGGGAQDGVFVTQACADSINFEGGATAALGIGAPFLAALETFYMQHGVAGETTMAELCGGGERMPLSATVQQLTAHTGTSLARACFDLARLEQVMTTDDP